MKVTAPEKQLVKGGGACRKGHVAESLSGAGSCSNDAMSALSWWLYVLSSPNSQLLPICAALNLAV